LREAYNRGVRPFIKKKLSDISGNVFFRTYSTPIIKDVDGDKLGDIVLGDNNGNIWVLNGKFRTKVLEIATDVLIEKNRNFPAGSIENEIRSPVSVADLNQDGQVDYVSISRQNNIVAVDGKNKILLWEYKFPVLRTSYPLFSGIPNLIDLENDGRIEIVTKLPDDDQIYVMDGRGMGLNAKIIWQFKIPGNFNNFPPAFCDVNKDGIVDIVISDGKNTLTILDGSVSTSSVKPLESITFLNGFGLSPVFIGDLDGNTRLDFLLLGAENSPVVFSSNIRYLKNMIIWGSPFGSPDNASSFTFQVRSQPYYMLLFGSLLILFLTVLINLVLYLRRYRKVNQNF